ncbi:MAG: hypothetical protein QOF99_8965 [Pseudonocardiales bacterium]|jgi:hypothetical protein|nr:hypothetical protein [Pseudonocardiales bacterium]
MKASHWDREELLWRGVLLLTRRRPGDGEALRWARHGQGNGSRQGYLAVGRGRVTRMAVVTRPHG